MNRDDTALALNGNRTVDNLSYVLTELRNQESSDSALAYTEINFCLKAVISREDS